MSAGSIATVQGVSLPTRVASLREVQWARFEPNFFVVFPEGPLDDAPRTYVLLARVEDAAARARLQRDVVEAHPNVSTLDLAQIQRAIEGVLDKVVLVFDEPFWDEDVHFLGHVPAEHGRFVAWLNVVPLAGEPALIAFNSGSVARDLERRTDDEVVAEALAVLRTMTG